MRGTTDIRNHCRKRRRTLVGSEALASTMVGLTTHVLDTSSGEPAGGIRLELHYINGKKFELIGGMSCEGNGRTKDPVISAVDMTAGIYRLRFFTKEYFAKHGKQCFYPYCDITFEITDTDQHYHVPLLLSPFGFSSYRGS